MTAFQQTRKKEGGRKRCQLQKSMFYINNVITHIYYNDREMNIKIHNPFSLISKLSEWRYHNGHLVEMSTAAVVNIIIVYLKTLQFFVLEIIV